jgi:hypothetical protein
VKRLAVLQMVECERLHARLAAARCAERHLRGVAMRGTKMSEVLDMCGTCQVGEKHAKDAGDAQERP